jgi:hypothetical protein
MTRRMIRAKQRPPKIDHTKIAKLLRLLGSDKPGEVVAAAAALKRTLQAGGQDLHDLAYLVETGLRPAQQPQLSWGPPAPSTEDWQAMAWFCHFHRRSLRKDDAEYVADCLLGTAFRDDYDVCTDWHMERLRRIVAHVRREAVEDMPW